MEGLREGLPGTLGLWLWPYPHRLRPCPPPPAHSSLAEVSPSGMGEPPPTSHITALHSLLFSSLPSRGGEGGLGVGPPSPLLLPSLGEGEGKRGGRYQECRESRLWWHPTLINIH